MTALVCERLITNLERLQLCYLATALDTSGTQATQPPWAYTDVRDRLIAEAVAQRQSRRVKTALQLAAFPSRKPLDGVDFAFQPSGPRARLQALATVGFGDRTDNLILLGPPGVGKTHLASALGVKAIPCGDAAYFTPLDTLVKQWRTAEVGGQGQRKLKP